MSSLDSNMPVVGLSRLEVASKRRKDSLAWWVDALGKSPKTVRRYAAAGLLPGAYRTNGGQWRAPFTLEALRGVKAKLQSWERKVTPKASVMFRRMRSCHNDATFYTVVYALFLGLTNTQFREAALPEFYTRLVTGGLNNSRRKRILKRARNKYPQWDACVRIVEQKGVREAALIAAYIHAVRQKLARSREEEVADLHEGQHRPFGHFILGTIGDGSRRNRKRCKRGRNSEDAVGDQIRERKRIGREAPTVSLKSVIQKWQWIMMRRGIRSAPIEYHNADTSHPYGHVFKPARYYAVRTFYTWYSEEDRRKAKTAADVFLDGWFATVEHKVGRRTVVRAADSDAGDDVEDVLSDETGSEKLVAL